jgi:hypothetical protein
LPKFAELKRYCERNGWELFRSGDHYWYRKFTEDGRLLVTKVSRSLGKEIPSNLWKFILKHQLEITREEFNRGS